MIGAPVSLAFMPRTRPSVISIEIQRTTLSPRCSATSTIKLSSWSLIAGLVIKIAFKMLGSFPSSKVTSTTGPMTWTIFPIFITISLQIVVLWNFIRDKLPRKCYPFARASVPPTISINSAVIAACLALFILRVKDLINSSQLLVALSMAAILAPFSPADVSRSAR